MNVKIIFCHHKFPKYWTATYPDNKTITWVKVCPKCGKTKHFTMPIDNVQSAWEHYQKLRKEFQ